MGRSAQCKKGWSGVLCSEKQVLANAAAVLLVKLLHPWNAPTATAEKCQKSNREIWKSVRALSQEIHLETCNEENLKWRSKKTFQQIPVCVLGDPPLHGIWQKSRATTLSEDPDTNKLQEA